MAICPVGLIAMMTPKKPIIILTLTSINGFLIFPPPIALIWGESSDIKFIEKGIRVILDSRNEKINYKVREHSVNKIPYIFVVGVNEMDDETVAILKDM